MRICCTFHEAPTQSGSVYVGTVSQDSINLFTDSRSSSCVTAVLVGDMEHLLSNENHWQPPPRWTQHSWVMMEKGTRRGDDALREETPVVSSR